MHATLKMLCGKWEQNNSISVILNQVLEKIKLVTGIEKLDDAKILIEKDDKLFDEVIKAVVLILRAIKLMLNVICRHFQKKHQ